MITQQTMEYFIPPEMDPTALTGAINYILCKWVESGGKIETFKKNSFFIQAIFDGTSHAQVDLRCANADESEDSDFHQRQGNLIIINELNQHTISIPLNELLRSVTRGHLVYLHGLLTETPLTYIGLTKQGWRQRLNQHLHQSRNGSNLLFHKALREHTDIPLCTRIVAAGLSYENAMDMEERLVSLSLYPRGLNMIPGGFAGLRYLSTLGLHAKTLKQRDALLEDLTKKPSLMGRPNPLCAARWATDQDFINRVICGHSGRLSVDEINSIRRLCSFGMGQDQIQSFHPEISPKKIANIVKGKYYSRVQ